MIKKSGFTLAEILIALTIIGVVAALTVPMLMSNTNAKTNKVMAKKAYATLSSALKIGQTKLDFDLSDITARTGTGDESVLTLENFLTKTMDVTKTTEDSYVFSGNLLKLHDSQNYLQKDEYTTEGIKENATIFKANDGTYYIFPTPKDYEGNIECGGVPCIVYIDINGKKGPNEVVTCTKGTEDYWNRVGMDTCEVDDSAVTDIYPFAVFSASIKPATNACAAVLQE